MFKIYDGREHFYQWDSDRKLIVEDPLITEVHFCNRTDDCSLVCETYVEDGVTLVNVPNILLQTDWKIRVYAYDGTYTKHDECYEVKSRTKPSDYIYTETEVWRVEEAVEKAVEEAVASGDFKGEPGKDGVDGKDGYTPLKGTDYWTDEDKAEIEGYIDEKGKDFVDLTSRQSIVGEKQFMVPLALYDVLGAYAGIDLINPDSLGVANLGIDNRTGKIVIKSTSSEMLFNDKRVLDVNDLDTIDNRLGKVETDIIVLNDIKANKGEVVELEENKADKETTEWQLIESVTLEEDVRSVVCDLKGGLYKELLTFFKLPTQNPEKLSDFPKGRTSVFGQGGVQLLDEGAAWYVDNGLPFYLSHYLKMVGNLCVGERKSYSTNYPDRAYAIGSGNERWAHTIGIPLEDNFLSQLKVIMYDSGGNTTWKFPAGTTYEIWGVKA